MFRLISGIMSSAQNNGVDSFTGGGGCDHWFCRNHTSCVLVISLKEKRMVVKSIIAKIQNKFNVSIAEVDEQDSLQTVVLGIAWVTGTVRQADGILEKVLSFIEVNTDAEIVNVLHELR